jgi:protein-S-isoprenylcysteine O-methyltransferase Ste14
VVYLPYMAVVYPFHLAGLDVRMVVAYAAIAVGFFLFVLGTISWFYGKIQEKKTVTFWIYRVSRHPQYLGFIVWSYGIMLLAAFQPVPFGGLNPGASLPWVISTLLVICIALSEETKMSREDRQAHLAYRKTAPFLFPVPRVVVRIVGAPLRIVSGKGGNANRRNVAYAFGVYLVLAIILSAPFALLKWPGQDWSTWPSGRLPGTGSTPKDSTPESSEPPSPDEEAPMPEVIPDVYGCPRLGTGSLNVRVWR